MALQATRSARSREGNDMRIDVNDLPEAIAELGQNALLEDVVVLKDGQPWLKIVKHEGYKPKVRLGLWEGQFEVPDDFCETPEDIIEDFYR